MARNLRERLEIEQAPARGAGGGAQLQLDAALGLIPFGRRGAFGGARVEDAQATSHKLKRPPLDPPSATAPGRPRAQTPDPPSQRPHPCPQPSPAI